MKLKKSDLSSVLSKALKIRQSKADAFGVRLGAANGSLQIDVAGQDESFRAFIPCEGDFTRVAFGMRLLSNAVMLCEGEDIEMSRPHSDNVVVVKSASRSMQIGFMPATEYAAESPTKPVVIPVDLLAQGLKVSKFSATSESHRHVLKSVHILADERRLRLESANGYEISVWEEPAICGKVDAIVPVEFVPMLSEMLRCQGAEVMLSENQIGVRHEAGHYFCKLSEGKYPSYSGIDSIKVESVGMLSRDELLGVFTAIKHLRSAEEMGVACQMEFTEKSCAFRSLGSSPLEQSIEGNFNPSLCCVNAVAMCACLAVFKEGDTVAFGIVQAGGNGIVIQAGGLRVFSAQMLAKQ